MYIYDEQVLELDGEEIKGRQNKPNVRAVPALTTVPLTDHKDSTDHNQKVEEIVMNDKKNEKR